ncbi:F-box/FBD/LRR-repeat protein-like protein, partial [Tanacetum coccineum]
MSCNSHKVGKLITQCPSLEDLRISRDSSFRTVKLGNLNVLFFPLRMLDTKSVTSSSIFQLVGSFKKIQELYLGLFKCKLLAEAGARKDVSTTFPCLKTPGFHSIDFANDIKLSFIFEMIFRSPNLQRLEIV